MTNYRPTGEKLFWALGLLSAVGTVILLFTGHNGLAFVILFFGLGYFGLAAWAHKWMPKDYKALNRGCLPLLGASICIFAAACMSAVLAESLAAFMFMLWIFSINVGVYWQTRLSSLSAPRSPDMDIPKSDEVVMSWGYDYQSQSYKIWMSPIVNLPSTRERMDVYMVVEEAIAGEYTSRQESYQDAQRANKKLRSVGWKVTEVDSPKLLKHLPHWVREAGGTMLNRDESKDERYNADYWRRWDDTLGAALGMDTSDRTFLLRKDLQAKVRERERQALEEAEFEKVMKAQPDWVVGTDNAFSTNPNSPKPPESKQSAGLPLPTESDKALKRQSRALGDVKFGRAKKLQPNWVVGTDNTRSTNRNFVKSQKLKPPPDLPPPPESDKVYIAWGYDYQSQSYKIWMSPIVNLPSSRRRREVYLSVEEAISGEYTSRRESYPDVEMALNRLRSVGWKVTKVDPPKLLKYLPYWVRESGGAMDDRDEGKDRRYNLDYTSSPMRYYHDERWLDSPAAPLREDLQSKIHEKEHKPLKTRNLRRR